MLGHTQHSQDDLIGPNPSVGLPRVKSARPALERASRPLSRSGVSGLSFGVSAFQQFSPLTTLESALPPALQKRVWVAYYFANRAMTAPVMPPQSTSQPNFAVLNAPHRGPRPRAQGPPQHPSGLPLNNLDPNIANQSPRLHRMFFWL